MPKTYRVLKMNFKTSKEEVVLEQEKPFVQYGSALTTIGTCYVLIAGGFPNIDLDLNLRES